MSLRTSAVALVILTQAPLACAGGSGPPTQGEPDGGVGSPPVAAPEPVHVPFSSFYENIFVRVTLEGVGPLLFLYDTGSPGIFLDEGEANKLGIEGGRFAASIGSIDLGERKIALAKTLVGGQTLPGLPREPIRGYAGNPLFEGYSVGIDFRDRELLIAPAAPPEATPRAPDGVGAEAAVVPFDLVKDYLSIPCRFSRGEADRRCLFDTGAMTSLTLADHWKTVPHPRAETLPQDAIDSEGNVLSAYFQRDEATMIGGFEVPGDAVKIAAEFELLGSVGRQLGLDLVGLVGVLSFKRLYSTIDYPNRRILFRRYDDLSWAPPSPFLGYGFLLDPGTLRVRFVAPESDAPAAGVKVDDKLVGIDGLSTELASPGLTLVQTVPGLPGETARFELSRAGQRFQVALTAEDLLPPP